jgi:hypothetical protein
MSITSKIDIDVDSAEFLALKAAFDKYETALKKMPAAWQNVGRASAATKTNFESVAAWKLLAAVWRQLPRAVRNFLARIRRYILRRSW